MGFSEQIIIVTVRVKLFLDLSFNYCFCDQNVSDRLFQKSQLGYIAEPRNSRPYKDSRAKTQTFFKIWPQVWVENELEPKKRCSTDFEDRHLFI